MNLTVDALPPEKLERAIATAMELTMHATGNYPAWWQGWRFDRAIRAWACGETSEVVRETMQLLPLSEPGQHGTDAFRRRP